MSLTTGKNTLKIVVSDDDDKDRIKFVATWFDLDYLHLLGLEGALVNASVQCGSALLPQEQKDALNKFLKS